MNAKEILTNAGITVIEKMTTPTRPGKKPRQVWEIVGDVKKYEHIIYNLSIKVKKYRGVLSCWEDPTEKLAEQVEESQGMTFAQQMKYKAQRAEERAEWLETRAEKHEQASQNAYDRSNQIASVIPLGQPILVGHHSEKRHRRDLDKISTNMSKSLEEANYAKSLTNRAKFNRDKASQNYSIKYLANRIKEAQASIRAVQRKIDGKVCTRGGTYQTEEPATGKRLEQLQSEIEGYKEEITYWQDFIKDKGGFLHSKESVSKGDWVLYRTEFYKVYRANKNTISIRRFNPTQKILDRCKYETIQAVVKQERVNEIGKKLGIDFNSDSMHATQIDLASEDPQPQPES